MAKTKAHARAQEAPSPTVSVDKRPEVPEKKVGPESAAPARVSAALPPPNGEPSAARAAKVLRFPTPGPGAGGRARMATAMQGAVGNARLGQLLAARSAPPSAAGLDVVHPDDRSEKEAEAVATRVSAGRPAPPIAPLAATGARTLSRVEAEKPLSAGTEPKGEEELLQTQVAAGEETEPELGPEEKEEPLQAQRLQRQPKEEDGLGPGGEATPATARAARLIQQSGQGNPLSPATRGTLEPRMGVDLGAARVHRDEAAQEAAAALKARAFTRGRDIYLGRGESEGDLRLMAHESAHVAQQGDATIQRHPGLFDYQTEREKIDAALESEDRADVKKISDINQASETEKIQLLQILAAPGGWVGPMDEYKIQEIWESFDNRLSKVMEENQRLWHNCIKRGAELDDLKQVEEIQKEFVRDVEMVAEYYLTQNSALVGQEMDRLGIPLFENMAYFPATPDITDEMQKMQKAAAIVATLQEEQEEIRRTVYVGYETDQIGLLRPVTFNPYSRPEYDARPWDIAPGTPPYELVKGDYDAASEVIHKILNLYPSLYAISREGKSSFTASFAELDDPEMARRALGQAFHMLSKDIEEARNKLGKDLDPLDLTPIHDQLYSEKNPLQTTRWKEVLPKWVAQDLVGDHNLSNALKTLGLKSAAYLLFLLAPFTGGASLYLMLGGLAVTGVRASRSKEHYETLAQAARTSAIPDTELVSGGEVEESELEAEAAEVELDLAVILLPLGLTGSPKTTPPKTMPPKTTPTGKGFEPPVFRPPRIRFDRQGQLTNGRYTISAKGMAPHKTGSLRAGKSQFLSTVDAEKAVLDAAAYADDAGLWVGPKAKVFVENGPVGVHSETGELTSWINVYRKKTGLIHGAPGGSR